MMSMATRSAVTLLCCLTGTAPAKGLDGYRDYASVVKVDPIIEGRHQYATRTTCEDARWASAENTAIASSIGRDIRRQRSRWSSPPSCGSIEEQDFQKRILGYWVTYRYQGHTQTKRLSYDPGDRLPVSIRLTPLQ